MRTMTLPIALLAACVETQGDEAADVDADGLLDSEEADLGTDPAAPDSDADGHDDGVEVTAGTNPLYEWSHPYEQGDYLVGSCPNPPDDSGIGPTGTGSYETTTWDAYQAGDTVLNWSGWDTYEQEVSLYTFCGNYVLVTLSAAWCGPCQALAEELVDTQDQVRQEYPNFVVFELLYQNIRGRTPSTDQLDEWKQAFALDGIPVVGPEDAGDPDLTWFEVDGFIPTSVILSPEMEVLSIDQYLTSAPDIEGVIAAHAEQ